MFWSIILTDNTAFGHVAQELTGKQLLNPTSAHSVVIEALEKKKPAEALATRLWMSFVEEGKDVLYKEDLVEILGPDRTSEAEECFAALDRDGNGDISLEEMLHMVNQIGQERRVVVSSMHDVDQAINVLNRLLTFIVFIICVFILGMIITIHTYNRLHFVSYLLIPHHSRFSQRKFRYHTRNGGNGSFVTFIRLRCHRPRSSWFMYIPVC